VKLKFLLVFVALMLLFLGKITTALFPFLIDTAPWWGSLSIAIFIGALFFWGKTILEKL
jgi:hypothetical protein